MTIEERLKEIKDREATRPNGDWVYEDLAYCRRVAEIAVARLQRISYACTLPSTEFEKATRQAADEALKEIDAL